MWREWRYDGKTCGRHRVARLMRQLQLYGIPQRRKLQRQAPAQRPVGVRNHLERDFSAQHANTKWRHE